MSERELEAARGAWLLIISILLIIWHYDILDQHLLTSMIVGVLGVFCFVLGIIKIVK
jgi:hypothetical protein